MHGPWPAVHTLPQPILNTQEEKTSSCPSGVKMTAAARLLATGHRGLLSKTRPHRQTEDDRSSEARGVFCSPLGRKVFPKEDSALKNQSRLDEELLGRSTGGRGNGTCKGPEAR